MIHVIDMADIDHIREVLDTISEAVHILEQVDTNELQGFDVELDTDIFAEIADAIKQFRWDMDTYLLDADDILSEVEGD